MAKTHGLRYNGKRVYTAREVAKKTGLGLRMVQRLSAKLGFRNPGRHLLLTDDDIETMHEYRRDHPPGRVPIN